MADSDEINIGEMQIAGNVLERMVKESASRVTGVSQVKDINVEPKEKTLVVEINLTVDYKSIYPEVAAEVQRTVIEDINRMTGVRADEVNVNIERLDFSKE